MIDGKQRGIDRHKIDVLNEMERPKTGKAMESFLGFVNFLRDYVPNFALIAGPLEKLRKVKRIGEKEWTDEVQGAWDKLKAVLKKAPVLSAPDYSLPFRVATDASQYGIGAVLYQVKEGKNHYIHFISKSLTDGQRNYPASKRELLAIMYAINKWSNTLKGNKFVVETDHKALCYLHSSSKYMILDWLDTILSFDFTVTYKKGIENILPDALSRLYQMSEQQEGETEDKDEEMVGEKQILFNSAELKVDGTQPEKFTVKFLKTMEERFGKRDVGNEQERLKLVVKVHNEAHVAGPGLYQKIFRDGYYWPGMWSMCHDVAANCLTCLKFNVGKVGFHPISPVTASLPMDMIAWDFAGPFKKTDDGYEYVLVIVDIASRFMILRKLKTKQMEEVAMVLLEVFADFGVPKSVQHDQDPLFMNQVLDRLRQATHWKTKAVVCYFPSQNGAVERYVGEFKKVLYKLINGESYNWDLYVPVVQMSLNQLILPRHKSAPFSVMFARKANKFENYESVRKELSSVNDLMERNGKMLEAVYPALEKRSLEVGQKRADKHNKDARGKEKKITILKLGTKVMKMVDIRSDKQSERFEGPYTVVKYDAEMKGYLLVDEMWELRDGWVPIARLKVIRGRQNEQKKNKGKEKLSKQSEEEEEDMMEEEEEEDEEEVYEVEEIRGSKGSPGDKQYLIKLKTTHKFVESQAAKAVVGQTIY